MIFHYLFDAAEDEVFHHDSQADKIVFEDVFDEQALLHHPVLGQRFEEEVFQEPNYFQRHAGENVKHEVVQNADRRALEVQIPVPVYLSNEVTFEMSEKQKKTSSNPNDILKEIITENKSSK